MLCWILSESTDRYEGTVDFENLANPDFENLKHLQNLGPLLLTEPCIYILDLIIGCVKYLYVALQHTSGHQLALLLLI